MVKRNIVDVSSVLWATNKTQFSKFQVAFNGDSTATVYYTNEYI